MEYEQFDALLRRGAESLQIGVDGDQSRRLFQYFQELKRWSRKVNLISKNAGDEEIVEKHFIDSLALLDLLVPSGVRLLDVGSGAGFPGLVCKAMHPEMKVGLVEPRLKRVSFLRHIIRLLGLTAIEVHGCRLEDTEIEDESTYNWVVSRAVAEVKEFLKLSERFRRYGSSVVCMKGPGYVDELDEETQAAAGWRLETIRDYRLPFSGAQRSLLVFRGLAGCNRTRIEGQQKAKGMTGEEVDADPQGKRLRP